MNRAQALLVLFASATMLLAACDLARDMRDSAQKQTELSNKLSARLGIRVQVLYMKTAGQSAVAVNLQDEPPAPWTLVGFKENVKAFLTENGDTPAFVKITY